MGDDLNKISSSVATTTTTPYMYFIHLSLTNYLDGLDEKRE